MGLTKRNGKYYVEFYVWDDGEMLKLARRQNYQHGARLQRWCTGTNNKTMAGRQETLIKTDLMRGTMESKKAKRNGPITFAKLTTEYLADPKVQRQATYQKKVNWVSKRFLPHFESKTPITSITQNDFERYLV